MTFQLTKVVAALLSWCGIVMVVDGPQKALLGQGGRGRGGNKVQPNNINNITYNIEPELRTPSGITQPLLVSLPRRDCNQPRITLGPRKEQLSQRNRATTESFLNCIII